MWVANQGPGRDLDDCARAALEIRRFLSPLRSFVKTSGVKGLHVYVPLNGRFAEVKPFARALARELAARHPDWLTDKMARAERVPLVSAPLDWSELDAPSPITPELVLARVARGGDRFAEVLTLRQSLS